MVDDRQTRDMPGRDGARQVIANASALAYSPMTSPLCGKWFRMPSRRCSPPPKAERKARERKDERLDALWPGQYDAADVGHVLADYGIAAAIIAALA